MSQARKAAEAVAEQQTTSLKKEIITKNSEHQKQLDQVRRAAETEACRLQRRAAAEAANLEATISRLEVDLKMVRDLQPINQGNCPRLLKLTQANKNKAQDLQALRDVYATKLEEQTKRTKAAEERLKAAEAKSKRGDEEIRTAEEKVQGGEKKSKAVEEKLHKLEQELQQTRKSNEEHVAKVKKVREL